MVDALISAESGDDSILRPTPLVGNTTSRYTLATPRRSATSRVDAQP